MKILTMLDFIFPTPCLNCGTIEIDRGGSFCFDCWKDLIFIKNPYCEICGLPFSYIENDDLICDTCHSFAPFYDQARCIFVYNDIIKTPILRLKHGDQTQISKSFAHLLSQNFKHKNECIDLIIPIPLHWKRLFKRQYNQAALIAQHFGKFINKPVNFSCFMRLKNTKSQGKQTKNARFDNLKDAFEVKNPSIIANKTILLIDDVMTTGSTLDQAAKALKKSGAKRVLCYCVARSVHHFLR